MTAYKSLISPRSRTPIVFPADDEEDVDENETIGRQSLALPSAATTLPLSMTVPSSILKSRGMGDREDSDRGRSGLPYSVQSKMDDEASAYRRRLETYRQAQHQQALLVARLQTKLLQYRQRCSDLESKLGQPPGQEFLYGSPTGTEHRGRDIPSSDLEDALWKLEQEKIRNENLLQLNGSLRGELDETRHINDSLSSDLQKISKDWEGLTQQMLEREQLWKVEEQAYSDYYASEHSKLLDLWKRISATKRDFADMKSSTGRDMAQLRNAIARMSNEISSSVLTAAVTAPTAQQEAQQSSFITQLTQEVQNASNTQEGLRKQLKERNDKISELDSVLQETQGKMQNLEQELNRIETQEMGRLNNCLQEIAKLLLNDFDQYGVEEGHDIHLTSTPAIFVFDESGDNNNPVVFAESVVSAVQAALNKRQLEIHQLQVNLSSQKEQSILVRGHVESLESDLSKAEEKIATFGDENERMKNEIENFKMDKETTQRTLESIKNEKNLLEQQRKALAMELDSTLRNKNSISSNLTKLEKSSEIYRDEVDSLRNDLEKVRDELSSATTQLKSEQELNSRIREQISFLGQDKERNASENKSLKTLQNELVSKYEDLLSQFERSEDCLKKLKMDHEILTDKYKSTTEQASVAEKDKKKLMEKLRQVEDVKAQYESRITEYESDLSSLRREALDAERNRMEHETRIEKLVEQADAAETKKSILETQLDTLDSQYSKEMELMSERVELLTEELNQSRRDYDHLVGNLERTKAELVNVDKLHMEAVHVVEGKEVALKNVTSALEKLRDEKLSFEELEDTMKKALIEKDRKIDFIEKQMADSRSKLSQELGFLKEQLTTTKQDSRILIEKAEQEKIAIESKHKNELENIKLVYDAKEEKLKAFYTEKLKVQHTELQGEKKSEMIKLNSEITAIKQQIDSNRIQYEEAMLRAENKFQQGLLLAQQDQQGLMERIRLMEKELDDSRNEKDRIRREYETKFSHEKGIASSLRTELMKLRNELDNNKQDNQDRDRQIELRISEIDQEREASLMQIEELKNKLRSCEEREAELTRELNDVLRKLKDMETSEDNCRKQLLETRHAVTDLSLEKEKSMTALEQLKDDVTRRDNENRNLKKELSKAQNVVKKMEILKVAQEEEIASLTSKLESAVRDISDSTKTIEDYNEQLLSARSQINRADSEVADLRIKLEAEAERREDAEGRFRNTRKMLEDAEARLNSSKNEEERLSLKLVEVEERYGNREGQLLQLAEEHKQREKKLLEEKHNLNVCLVSVQQQMEQLGSKLAKAEDRLRSLMEERTGLEARKKDAEAKLSQFQSGLKRLGLANVGIDNVEAVRRVMVTLQAQLTSIQQDRDTMAAQLSAAKDNVNALEISKTQFEDQVSQLNRNLQNAQSIQKGKESALLQAERDLEVRNNELRRLAEKLTEFDENVKGRDEMLRAIRAEKETQREEFDRSRQRWEEARSQNDSKWTKAEVQIRSLEGDLNRMSMVLQQKELHIQTLEDKCSANQRNMNEIEQRCSALTMTVEQLNITNEKALQGEREWKEKYNGLNRNLNENVSNLNILGEKVRSLQREKTMLEQDRNNLNERWEACAAALTDFKRQVQVLADKNQKLRHQTEEMTRNAIDKQLKISIAESGKEDLRLVLGDKLELQRKIDTLMERIRELEQENRELDRLKDIPQIRIGRTAPYVRDNATVVLEEENAELRRKVSKFEGEIRDLERRHAKHVGEVTLQVKQERDLELERARAGKLQAERLLEARESNYRQQVHRLEQQVAHLKEQLSEEIKRRQSFLSKSFRTGQEIRSLRQALGDSLRNVAMDPSTIESETRRLDSTLDHHRSTSQASMLSPMRDLTSPAVGLRASPIPRYD